MKLSPAGEFNGNPFEEGFNSVYGPNIKPGDYMPSSKHLVSATNRMNQFISEFAGAIAGDDEKLEAALGALPGRLEKWKAVLADLKKSWGISGAVVVLRTPGGGRKEQIAFLDNLLPPSDFNAQFALPPKSKAKTVWRPWLFSGTIKQMLLDGDTVVYEYQQDSIVDAGVPITGKLHPAIAGHLGALNEALKKAAKKRTATGGDPLIALLGGTA